MADPPDLLDNFKAYAHIQQHHTTSNTIDLSDLDWLYPSTLLPSVGLIANHPASTYLPPRNIQASGYVDAMISIGTSCLGRPKTYIPVISLPRDEKKLAPVLDEVYRMNNNGREYGGMMAFKLMVGEFTTNIYEHSYFSHAYVMAQKYPSKGFVDVSFYDDGITIPGSLDKAGMMFANDYESIALAVNGLSSKNDTERGYGLHTNIRICIEGIGAEVLIASGKGVLHFDHGDQKAYMLRNEYKLSGTSINIRLPYPAKEVNIYDYQS